MDAGRLALRILFIFIYLLVVLRLSGKRTVWHGNPIDLVMSLALGDLIDNAIFAEVSMARFVAASLSLLLCHAALSVVESRFSSVAKLLLGSPITAINEGEFLRESARIERLSRFQQYMLLRDCGIRDMREVKAMRIEPSGHPSAVKHEWAEEITKRDLQKLIAGRAAAPESAPKAETSPNTY